MNNAESKGLVDLLLRAVVESHSIVVVTDAKCNVEYVNERFCQTTGFSREEIVGQNIHGVETVRLAPADCPEFWSQMNKAGEWHGEFRNLKKNGEAYVENAVITVIRNEQGEIEHYLKVSDDVTVRMALEAELEASRMRYERVVRAMHGFMFTVLLEDGRPVRTLHYPGTMDVTGYTADEYRQFPELWYNMIVEEDRPLVTSQIEYVQREKQQHSVEHRITHKNGTVRWVRNVSVPNTDAAGQLVSYDGLITDITQLKEAEAHRDRLFAEMRLAAVRDPLTGLYSRRMFDEEIGRAWQLSERRGQPLSILLMDIDHFKVFNDTFGHQVGDQILVEAGRLTGVTVRAGDVVCRYGGDEIVVILPLTGTDEAQRVGARLLDAFRQHAFCRNSQDLRATVSIGAATGEGRIQTVSDILMYADHALYHAKHMGRNMLCFFEPNAASSFVTVGNSDKEAADVSGRLICAGRGRILLVDDDVSRTKSTRELLEREQFQVAVASSFGQALQISQDEPGQLDVLLADEVFVNDERDILRQLRVKDDTLVGVIMKGTTVSAVSASAAFDGVAGFLEKPVSPVQLVPMLEKAVLQRKTLQENRRCMRAYGDMVAERSAALTRMLGHAKQAYLSTLDLLATVFEVYDRDAAEHCKRSGQMASILANEVNYPGEDVEMLGHAAALHDMGRIGIPDTILRKRGPLTLDEWKIMKLHAQIGHDVLRGCASLKPAAGIILEHHERFDGSGYPCGLKETEICSGARIIAIVDAYDTIRSNQPYARARSEEAAVAEIVKCRGVLFDPEFVDGFLRCQTRIESCVSGGRET